MRHHPTAGWSLRLNEATDPTCTKWHPDSSSPCTVIGLPALDVNALPSALGSCQRRHGLLIYFVSVSARAVRRTNVCG